MHFNTRELDRIHYIHRGIIDSSARSGVDEKFVSVAKHMGMPWIFGFDPEKDDRYFISKYL